MIRRQLRAIVGSALLAMTILCSLAAVHLFAKSGEVAQAASPATPSAAVAGLLPDLDEPATPSDRLPSFLARGPQVLRDSVPESARFLGVNSDVRYWSALNTDGEVCLIALLSGTAESAAMSCASPQDVLNNGLGLQVSDSDVAVRAFVVPDDYVPAAPGFDKVSRNLIVESANTDMAPTVLNPRSKASSLDPIELTQFVAASDLAFEG